MAIDFPDVLRSTRADGRLIEATAVNDPTNRFRSTFIGAVAIYDESTAVLSFNVLEFSNSTGMPKYGDVIFIIIPASIPRSNSLVSIAINNNAALPFRTVDGVQIKANQITPGRLFQLLAFAGQLRLIDFLYPRPQDYAILSAVSEDVIFTEAEVLAGVSSNNDLVAAPIRAADDPPAYLAFGVPADTGDIIELIAGVNQLFSFTRIPGVIDIGGIDYKFWRSFNLLLRNISGRVYRVVQSQD